jgi:hypothetical protein
MLTIIRVRVVQATCECDTLARGLTMRQTGWTGQATAGHASHARRMVAHAVALHSPIRGASHRRWREFRCGAHVPRPVPVLQPWA